MDQIDMFADVPTAVQAPPVKAPPVKVAPAEPLPTAEDNALDRVLATSAIQVVLDNLPPTIEFTEDQMCMFILPDGSGPPSALNGTLLDRLWAVRDTLDDLWRGGPYRERPPIFGLRLPPIDKVRRRRIEALARECPSPDPGHDIEGETQQPCR